MFARQMVSGARVLDVGCGTGYGAEVLRGYSSYTGVDLSEESLANARATFGAENVDFRQGDACDLPFGGEQFDVVVCFEMLEHVHEPSRVVAEIRRVLVPGGVVVASTPDRTNYNATLVEPNEFHVHEMERYEFEQLLASQFAEVSLHPQSYVSCGVIAGTDGFETIDHAPLPEWAGGGSPRAVYWLALASDAELPPVAAAFTPSVEDRNLGKELVITFNQLQETERELAEARARHAASSAEMAVLRRRIIELKNETREGTISSSEE